MGIIVEKLLIVYFECILKRYSKGCVYKGQKKGDFFMSEINKSPWPGPKGLIPVTSGKAEDANVYNRNFLDSIHMEMRVIDSLEPDLTTKILGVEYASPIMMPAFSHLNKVGKDGKKPMIEYAKVAKELNMLN